MFSHTRDLGQTWAPNLVYCNAIGFSIHWLVRTAMRGLGLRQERASRALLVGLVLGGTVMGLALSELLLRLLGMADHTWFGFLSTAASALLVAGLTSALALAFLNLKENLERKAMENQRLQELQTRTRLMVLQSKINPHFLFNTLNTMLNLVYKSPAEVEAIILNLSGIYRRVLELPETGTIQVSEELALIRQYLEIEQIRLGERLTYTLDMDPEAGFRSIPPLLIEPLVENAVLHGIAPRPEGGHISILVRDEETALQVIVEDNGVGLKTDAKRLGFGLQSVQERLRLLHGEGHFRLENRPEGGVRAELEVPHGH